MTYFCDAAGINFVKQFKYYKPHLQEEDVMKIDPYKQKEMFLNWKKRTDKGIAEISKVNSKIILDYISDMENGLNVSSNSVKGPRSYIRLNNLRVRMVFLAKNIERHCGSDLPDVTEEQVVKFFNAMRNGTIKRNDGKVYKSVADYVKTFKAFWHWHMKRNRKAGVAILDITEDLDVSREKPRWVYLSQKQLKLLHDKAKSEYKVLIMFMYDTGIRSPTELINVKVGDIYEDFKKLHIRQEIVKKGSFGRKINLMMSSEPLRQYVEENQLQADGQLFKISPQVVNQYLKRLAKRVLGEAESLAGEKYCNLTMYDFRHCSCCYWLPRYKSESALKYRFGWRKSDKIHYYSELLGMKDTIKEEDMLIDVTKTEIEKELMAARRKVEVYEENTLADQAEKEQLKKMMQFFYEKLQQFEQRFDTYIQSNTSNVTV